MTSDEALMLEFQQGSGEAFTELFRRYCEPIYPRGWHGTGFAR